MQVYVVEYIISALKQCCFVLKNMLTVQFILHVRTKHTKCILLRSVHLKMCLDVLKICSNISVSQTVGGEGY